MIEKISSFVSFLIILTMVFCACSYASPKVVLPLKEYPSGIHAFSPMDVPEQARLVLVSALRKNWADTKADVISVRVEISEDYGKTWAFLFGFKTSGGVIKDKKTGLINDRSWIQFALPKEGLPGRKLRGTVECYEPLVTELSVDLQ